MKLFNQTVKDYSLTGFQKYALLLLSFLVVAFGQPVWSWWLGLAAAIGGYACFWRVLLSIHRPIHRFYIAMGWYIAVQCIQLSWFASHPYLYIYAVILLCATIMGIQWGILALWIQPSKMTNIRWVLALAGLWTVFEWSRLFILSGLPFNPAGLALTGAVYPLQLASIGGLYGLSFWVILTNLLVLRLWIIPKTRSRLAVLVGAIMLPYVFGAGHLFYHENILSHHSDTISVVLVQSALPIEENISFQSASEALNFVLDEWRQILTTLKKQVGKKIDFIIFPEYVVPYGTFHHVYPVEQVHEIFHDIFGSATDALLAQKSPYIQMIETYQGPKLLASNAYFAQILTSLFNAHSVVGLEDSVYVDSKKAESYSAAFHFSPDEKPPRRYEKRVLAPMGEYIPFEWCKKLAAQYGIVGSFTPGTCSKVFDGPVPFGISICYEEIYGNLMRQNRVLGAELLVNLTNDGWYPFSNLPKQHFDHARLRTVENGIPLIRACNTGVTGAFDSLGQIVGVLGDDPIDSQYVADSIHLEVPRYHYRTLYSNTGDAGIIGLSCLCILVGFIWRRED